MRSESVTMYARCTLVELHAVFGLDFGLEGPRLLNRDDPSLPTFSIASARIRRSPDRWPRLSDLEISLWYRRPSERLHLLDRNFHAFRCVLDQQRIAARGHVAEPSRMIACASTVAVVVPSPAMSLVFDATSLTS